MRYPTEQKNRRGAPTRYDATQVIRCVVVLATACGFSTPARADLVLETETARLGKQGSGCVGNAIQVERDQDGTVTEFTLTAFELAPTDRIEVLIEPFFWERIIPKDGPVVKGKGDTEVTLSWLAIGEKGWRPAVVFATKEKIPTSNRPEIGTGKRDFTGYLILGKELGPLDFNVNLAGERFGSPPGEKLKDQFIYDTSAQFDLGKSLALYAEYFGNSAPTDDAPPVHAHSFAAEISLTTHFNAFLSFGRDSEGMDDVRSGVNLVW